MRKFLELFLVFLLGLERIWNHLLRDVQLEMCLLSELGHQVGKISPTLCFLE